MAERFFILFMMLLHPYVGCGKGLILQILCPSTFISEIQKMKSRETYKYQCHGFTGSKSVHRLKGGSPVEAGPDSDIFNKHNISSDLERKLFALNDLKMNTSELPRASPGPLTTGERALLHAMRMLTLDKREKTLGKVADEDPLLAEKLKNAGGSMNDFDWKRFDAELEQRMASKYAEMATQVLSQHTRPHHTRPRTPAPLRRARSAAPRRRPAISRRARQRRRQCRLRPRRPAHPSCLQ